MNTCTCSAYCLTHFLHTYHRMDIEHTDELVFFVNGKKVSEILS